MKFGFSSSQPPVGFSIVIDRQTFKATKVEDGKIYWRSKCAECGSKIEMFSGMRNIQLSRRCKTHAQPGVKVVRTPSIRRLTGKL